MTKGEVGEVQSPEERRTVKEPRRSVASSARNGAAVALRARSSEALWSKRGWYEVVETRLRCRREGGSRGGDEATVTVVGGCGWRRGCLDGIWGIKGRVSG